MAQQKIPEQATPRTTQYLNLLGLDYQSDPTEISRYRSPDMVNMISDEGGNPIKRFGYRSIGNTYVGLTELGGQCWAVKRISGKLYIVPITIETTGDITEGTAVKLSDHTNYGDVKHVFGFKSHIYVLCRYEWFEYDPEHSATVAIGISNTAQNSIPADKIIPTVMTMYKPNGSELVTLPAGTSLIGATQGVNILTPWRRVEFCVTADTASDVKFYIPKQAKMIPTVKVEVIDASTYEWKEVASTGYSTSGATTIQTIELNGSVVASLSVVDAIITFNAAPYTTATIGGVTTLVFKSDTSLAVPAGMPNVRITYAAVSMESTSTISEVVESTLYSSTTTDFTTITLTNTPHSFINILMLYGGNSYSFEFKAGTAETITKGDLTAIYNGAKKIEVGTPSLWTTVSPSLVCSQSLTVGAAVTNATVQSVNYDVIISSLNAYLGFFRLDRSRLFASDAIATYDSRLFAASKARTYYSRATTPFMIDDNYYFDVDQPIMLYAKTSSALAVIAGGIGESPIYLAKGDYDSSLAMPVYSITASNASAGAIARNVMGVLNDEPIFLSDIGLFGISSNYYSNKYSVSRSGKINKRLTKEEGLANAVGAAYNNYFYLAINGKMYVLDGRHRDQSRNGDNSYECYYFEGLPTVTKIYVVGERMYFTDNTYLYTWNDGLEGEGRYYDNATVSVDGIWDGTPVECMWSSRIDDDGAPQYYKTLSKKGTMVTIAPPMQTSCEVTIKKDAYTEKYIGRFDGSTFLLSESVLDAFTKKKIKKYKRLQFIIENKKPEPFGLISIVKTYTIGNFAKR